MSTAAPNVKAAAAPLIRESEIMERGVVGAGLLAYLAAGFSSLVFHGFLAAVLAVLAFALYVEEAPTETINNEAIVQSEPPEEPPNEDPLTVTDIDPEALDPDVEINYDNERKAEVPVPGLVKLDDPIGIEGASLNTPPMPIHAPAGFGVGQGGALKLPDVTGDVNTVGATGGYFLNAAKLAGTFYGRSGATRQQLLREGGGTKATEAAVAKGLHWLIRVQYPDGAWRMQGPYPDGGRPNDIAATAFGLLPFLGAGKTHRASKDNPFDKPIERAILFLLRKQDRRNGNFGGGMYAHALASIAICECYGLTQDPALRRPAQAAINYLISAQHSAGGWRYSPGQAGDTSVSGWVIMALKSAKMAGLDVPEVTFRKATRYLDSCRNPGNEGYGYVGRGSSYTMTAVGLLCRQYLQSWGPNNPRMIKGIQSIIKRTPPGRVKNMYYYYYATQVMHHFGGDDWKWWNEKMRAELVKNQARDGSWNPAGAHSTAGGRMMETSLSLLTLEVYYRYLPLYYREAGERQSRLLMGAG